MNKPTTVTIHIIGTAIMFRYLRPLKPMAAVENITIPHTMMETFTGMSTPKHSPISPEKASPHILALMPNQPIQHNASAVETRN